MERPIIFIEKEEKLHKGSILIAIGMILFFCGYSPSGPSLGIGGHPVFFALATVVNLIDILVNEKRIRKSFVFGFLVFMVILAFGALFFSADWGTLLSYAVLPVFAFSCYFVEYNEKDICAIVHGFIISALIFSFLIIFNGTQYYGILTTAQKLTYQQSFGNHIKFEPNFLGLLLVIAFELSTIGFLESLKYSCGKRKKFFYLLAVGVTAIAMLMTGSRSAMVTAIFFLPVLIFVLDDQKLRKRAFTLVAVIVFLLILMIVTGVIQESIYERMFVNSYNDSSNQQRFTLWIEAIKAILDKPWGAGLVSTEEYLQETYGYTGDAHNTFLSFGVQFGVLGLLISVILVLTILKRTWAVGNKKFWAILLSMIIEWNVLACQCALPAWVILIVILIKNKQAEERAQF